MESLIKGLSVMKTGFNSLLKLSPLYEQNVEKAAKENPSLRVVLKASKGQMPDIKDLYDLTVSSRKKDMMSDLLKVERKDPHYDEFRKLMNDSSTLQSASALTKFWKLLTGDDINFNQNDVTSVQNGNIVETSENIAQINMIYVTEFFFEGFTNVNTFFKLILEDKSPSMMIDTLTQVNVSELSKIKLLHTHLDNDKFKITDGSPSFLPNPDASRIIEDFASVKKMSKQRTVDTNKVIDLVSDLMERTTSLVTRLLHDATTANESSLPSVG